jgi:glyoxylase-like metal-dependent hydrolase (beta-lactamase superfamily II)
MNVTTISSGYVSEFLISHEGSSLLIDAGPPGKSRSIIKQIREAGVDLEEIDLIVITHVHYDHIGSLCELREATGAKVAVQAQEASFLRTGKSVPVVPKSGIGRVMTGLIASSDKQIISPIEPDVIVDSEYSLSEFGFDGSIIHTPGHTPGSLSVFIREGGGQVFIGDLLMRKLFLVGKPGLPKFASSVQQVRESVATLRELAPARYYASHGGEMEPKAIDRLLESQP